MLGIENVVGNALTDAGHCQRRFGNPFDKVNGICVFFNLFDQLVVLLLIFSIPPILLYSVFGTAEQDKQHLLLEAVRENGRTVARALTPFVMAMQPGDLSRIPAELERFGSEQRNIKVLFRPAGTNAGFYYVASAPAIAPEALAAERQRLVADLDAVAADYQLRPDEVAALKTLEPLEVAKAGGHPIAAWVAVQTVAADLRKAKAARGT